MKTSNTHYIFAFFLLFFTQELLFAQESGLTQKQRDSIVKEEIFNVVKSGGIDSLKYYLSKNRNRVRDSLIMDIAESGRAKMDSSLINIALVCAEENNDSLVLATVYWVKGSFLTYVGDKKSSLYYLDKALEIAQKIDDLFTIGKVWVYRAEICMSEGKFKEADEYFARSLPAFEKINLNSGRGIVWTNRADIAYYEGRHKEAKEYLDTASSFFENVKNKVGMGNVWSIRGDIFLSERRYKEAEECYVKALPFFAAINDILGEANVWKNRGNICLNEGRNKEAEEHYAKALTIYEKINNFIGQGNVWNNLGRMCLEEGKKKEAREYLSKARVFFERSNNIQGLGNVCLSLGEICKKEGNYKEAKENFSNALTFYEKIGNPIGMGIVWAKRGEVCMNEGNSQEALEYYKKAQLFFEKINDLSSQGNVIFSQAEAYEKLNQTQNAIDSYKKSLEFIEDVRSNIGSIESKQSYFEKYASWYVHAAAFMFKNGSNSGGFKTLESMKARAFLDMLAERNQGLEQGLSSELINKRDSLRNRKSALQKQLIEMYGGSDEEFTKIEKEITQLDIAYKFVVGEMRRESPKAASILYPRPVELSELQSKLKTNECVLEYLIGDSAAFCSVITKDSFNVVELKQPGSKSFRYSALYGELIYSWLSRVRAEQPPPLNTRLYDLLIKPVERYIQGKDLLIIPDGILYYFPFEAMICFDGKGFSYLINKHKIKYFQSSSLLVELREGKATRGNGFFGIGDPVFDYANYKAEKQEYGTIRGDTLVPLLPSIERGKAFSIFPRLVGSGIEIAVAAKIFAEAGKDTMLYKRTEATEENLKKADLSKYGYIHFSTHGLASPEFQLLALSNLPGMSDDGFFTIDEFMGLRLNAQLVVMSACQTGLGKLHRGEGMSGLTRAAMFAGSDAALSSLWSVSDVSTTKFMIQFYKYMIIDKMSKSEALRQTKLDFLNKNESFTTVNEIHYIRDPYFWSAFVMYGE